MNDALPRRPGPVRRLRVTEWAPDRPDRSREDRVAVEEPLEIRISAPGLSARSVGVVMRTPGHDFELAAGWLVSEGVVAPDAITSVAYCTDVSLRPEQEFNVVTIDALALTGPLPQPRLVDSACGVCGSDSVATVTGPPPADVHLDAEMLAGLPGRLRASQKFFDRTGGTHGAALVDAGGDLVVVREDVGRHNALDKALGHCFLARRPVPPIAVLSGRVGYELMQKAVPAGVAVVVAVGAPTSLALDIALATDRTLVGFTRPDRLVVYAGGHRIAPDRS